MMEDLAAEIEYIKIKGISYAPRSCQKCSRGIANENNTLCEPCPVNNYFDEQKGECSPCPADSYDRIDQHGRQKCVRREPCSEKDYYAEYGECDRRTLTRIKSYKWKEPVICDKDNKLSQIQLP